MAAIPISRVTGGRAAGRRLRRAPVGTRPATARMRAAIFDRPDVAQRVVGRVLDLYAGAGLLGVEALSRGAAWVDFVERSRTACGVIQRNVAIVGGSEQARVLCLTVERALPRLHSPYELCFADPPYAEDAGAALAALAETEILAPTGLLLWRHATKWPAVARLGPLACCDTRRYGDGILASYRRASVD